MKAGKLGMSRRQALALGGVGVAAAAFPSSLLAAGRTLQWGSATLGSTGYVIIEALTHVVNRNTDLRNSSMSTSGTTENMMLIHEGHLDFAQSASVDWRPALAGEAPFPVAIEAQQMFSYTTWAMPPIVRATSDIRSLADLEGRRASPGAAGASTRTIWEPIFAAAGIQDSVRWSYGSWREIYDAFRAGSLDCVPGLMVNGEPSPILQELETSEELRVLDVPDELIAAAQEVNAGIMSQDSASANWATAEEGLNLPGSSGILAAGPQVEPEIAYQVTKAIFDHEEDARAISRELEGLRTELAARYLIPGVPVNAGAAQYLREAGVWRDDLTVAE